MLKLPRRDVVLKGGAAIASFALAYSARLAQAFPIRDGEIVVPWLDQPPPLDDPTIKHLLKWEELDSWITPNDKFFGVVHFEWPKFDLDTWKLHIGGLVKRKLALTLADIKARPRKEVVFTLECSGNHGSPDFTGGIGTAKWAGTPLAPILEEAGLEDSAIETVFWGMDAGDIELKDMARDAKMHQNFARSMSVKDAMSPDNLLCYEMNGEPLPADHGAPLRLIAPGWYGIANVKWLKRIEFRDVRFESKLMGRDYVAIREEVHDGETYWAETSVGRAKLKSAPARVTKTADGTYRITGAAWGGDIQRVEVSIDGGNWTQAQFDAGETAPFDWRIWYLDWPDPPRGEHTVTSRAIDQDGKIQPAMDDPVIAKQHTWWEANGQITRRVKIT
jgi:DMSO/TMAO reductase YedYZ molybdopterin-dependent catalytic subunit